MTKKLTKILPRRKFVFFRTKIAIYLAYLLASIENIQATGEASALKREHPLQKMKFINFFSIFVGHFCPPGSGSNLHPDPQHCCKSR
jgi:hypothetical protein